MIKFLTKLSFHQLGKVNIVFTKVQTEESKRSTSNFSKMKKKNSSKLKKKLEKIVSSAKNYKKKILDRIR